MNNAWPVGVEGTSPRSQAVTTSSTSALTSSICWTGFLVRDPWGPDPTTAVNATQPKTWSPVSSAFVQ